MAVVRFREVHYSPEDNVKALLDALPAKAMRSLDCEIYGLTDMDLVQAMIVAKNRGVTVRVMADRSQSSGPAGHAACQALVNGGVNLKIVESSKGKIDHLKQLIVDGADGAAADSSSVLKGSYNFSDGAESQDNFIDWTNDPGEVQQAMDKFEDDWQHNEQRPEWQLTAE